MISLYSLLHIQLRLVNNAGQVIFLKSIEHDGSNAAQTVLITRPVITANYLIEITGANGYIHTEKIRILAP